MNYTDMPLPLDVVLVRGTGIRGWFLCALQSIRLGRLVRFSHALLSLGEGALVHAVIPRVGIIRPLDVWHSKKYHKNPLVLRRTALNSESEISALIEFAYAFSRLKYHEKYNLFFGIPKSILRRKSSFCSELVVQAHRLFGTEFFDTKRPEKVYPGHLSELAVDIEWSDVSNIYKAYTEEILQGRNSNSNVVASTRYKTGEAQFLLFENMLNLLRISDANIESLGEHTKKITELTRLFNEAAERVHTQ